jgi:hypothetical protein
MAAQAVAVAQRHPPSKIAELCEKLDRLMEIWLTSDRYICGAQNGANM